MVSNEDPVSKLMFVTSEVGLKNNMNITSKYIYYINI
jgi:hypothetical protein